MIEIIFVILGVAFIGVLANIGVEKSPPDE